MNHEDRQKLITAPVRFFANVILPAHGVSQMTSLSPLDDYARPVWFPGKGWVADDQGATRQAHAHIPGTRA